MTCLSYIQNSIPNKIRNETGFTFVELILTTMIMSVALLGGYTMMNQVVVNSVTTDRYTMASQLANEKLEEIVADKVFNGYAAIEDDTYEDESDFDAPYNDFVRTVAVQEVSSVDLSTPSAGSGFKKVDVLVVWGEEDYESIVVSTLLTEY